MPRASYKYISAKDKKIPEHKFKSLKDLNRYKNLALFLPIEVLSRDAPWGYVKLSGAGTEAIADEKAILVFKKAIKYLQTHSYQEVSQWMGACGFPISDDGLRNLVTSRPYWPELDLPYAERLKL
jgi:hypothetical protein